jgi:putative hemolysin
MDNISIKNIIENRYPDFFKKYPFLIRKIVVAGLKKLIHQKEINAFLSVNTDKTNFEFIEEAFEHFDFTYIVSNKEIQKIPSEGRLIVVANHPLGSFDGLALLKAIGEIRKDVKIVANEILQYVTPLKDMFIPYNLDSKKIQRLYIQSMEEALNKEQCIIFFPGAEVSRLTLSGIKDPKWQKGPLYFARKCSAPILPIFIKGRNSIMFYAISLISKSFSRLLLPSELFKQRGRSVHFKIGDHIPFKAFNSDFIDIKTETKLLKKHVYKIGMNQKGIYKTEKNIIFPVERKTLKKELERCTMLGRTKNDFGIFITDVESTPGIIREIARLREVTFRKVGEGTGKKADTDTYDSYYKHIFIWDDSELEIIGAYRIGICESIYKQRGISGLYSSSLFNYSDEFINKHMHNSIELGRSFVQKKYWNSNALDYLWLGIGAYINHNPQIKYMFGPVSLSNSFPDELKIMIIYFYQKWFGANEDTVIAKKKFIISEKSKEEMDFLFRNKEFNADFKTLKYLIKTFGFTLPPLFKQYSELCDENGVKFYDFSIDTLFNNCVDGLILVEIDKIKDEKKERYIYNTRSVIEKKAANM